MAIVELEIVSKEDISQISILYDQLQIFRSVDKSGSPHPFVSITESSPTKAILDGSISGPWNLNGTSLSIQVDGATPITVSFSGIDPFLQTTVIAAINSALSKILASEVPSDTGRIRLTSPSTGTQSFLEVSGTASAVLGLSTSRVNGKGANLLLSPNTEIYRFFDLDSAPSFWYKARYVNSVTGAISSFSDPFLGVNGVALPTSSVVTGSVAMADISGNPIVGRRIIFVPVGSQVVSDGVGNNYGILPSVDRVVVVTDSNGRASVSLVKGQRLKVFLEGTTFQREFVVPTTDFDILTVASLQPDPLSIVSIPPFPIRVS